jgi:hypothetical protein
MIAEVEIGTSHGPVQPTIAPDGSFDPGNPQPVVFNVSKWLKKPSSYTGDTIKIAIDDNDACRMSTKSDYYVIFLQFQKTPFPKGSPLEGAYEPLGGYGGIYGVRSASIAFGGISKYWGWPVDRFESEVVQLLQKGAPPAPTIATK